MKHIIKIGILACLFLVKPLNAQDFEWAKSFGGTASDEGQSISIDALGNVYTTGSFQGTVDFDPGTGISNITSEGGNDIFVQKMDAEGKFIWVKSFAGASSNQSLCNSVDASGNVYTIGYFGGTVDFDPGLGTLNLTSNGSNDVFVQKLNASGEFQWAKSFGGTNSNIAYSVTVDAAGNVYTLGTFQGTVDLDPSIQSATITSKGLTDIFVQKLNTSGEFQWAKSFGSTNVDRGFSITVDLLGNIYTTGYFSGITDFDPGVETTTLNPNGLSDVFVHKMDAAGNFQWVKNFGVMSSESFGYSITVDASGNTYTTGRFLGTVDFDPGVETYNLTSAGSDDVFVQKIDASGNFLWARSFGGTSSDEGRSIAVS